MYEPLAVAQAVARSIRLGLGSQGVPDFIGGRWPSQVVQAPRGAGVAWREVIHFESERDGDACRIAPGEAPQDDAAVIACGN
ncbi:MAG: hypothetical protein GIX03_10760 [Candidatus Eremiobacteraeota bacterium]|nr:hypothetical protein [Candidatus Eremiobacteraeota bacterium]MBC5803451.1 hypothetical protein [Candidatus Eremiobacteraeota bacterium]MBC5823204.1 hypothetical protein [Candidatus Eremiobacteraeota bacterium]